MAKSNVKFLHGKKENIPSVIANGKADADDIIITSDTDEIIFIDHDADGNLTPVPLRSIASEEIILEKLPTDESGEVIDVTEYVEDKIGSLGTDTDGNPIETVTDYVQNQFTIREY